MNVVFNDNEVVFNEWRTDAATRNIWWRHWNDQRQQHQQHGEQTAVYADRNSGAEASSKRWKTDTATGTK